MTEPTDEERRLMALTDEELLAEIGACEVDVLESPAADLLYGEAERRELDI